MGAQHKHRCFWESVETDITAPPAFLLPQTAQKPSEKQGLVMPSFINNDKEILTAIKEPFLYSRWAVTSILTVHLC